MVAGVIGVAVAAPKMSVPVTYRLAFTENFNGRRLDPKVWQRIPAGRPDWNRNMSLREDLIVVTNGICSLRGIKNDGKDPSDTRAVLTGGIMTKDRLVLQYGKVEFRMKLENGQQGAWPAVWMTPFYLMIDMQLGGNWVGKVDETTLPVAMHVDWVKFYRAEQNGKPLGTFGKPK